MRPGGGRRLSLRSRHPLTAAEEQAHLIAGSELFNDWQFFECHEEWEEIWRRSSGSRRELMRGLIQTAVGYEHLRRGNATGAVSLLRQGARRLINLADLPESIRRPALALSYRATGDAARIRADPSLRLADVLPPSVWVMLARTRMPAPPSGSMRIPVPRQ